LLDPVSDKLFDQLVDVFDSWMDVLLASRLVLSFDARLDVLSDALFEQRTPLSHVVCHVTIIW